MPGPAPCGLRITSSNELSLFLPGSAPAPGLAGAKGPGRGRGRPKLSGAGSLPVPAAGHCQAGARGIRCCSRSLFGSEMCNVPFLAQFKDTLERDLFTLPLDYYSS